VQVYFCDPHSPWQRSSNENINGLFKTYGTIPASANVGCRSKLHRARS
jgi:IS30 family transposase